MSDLISRKNTIEGVRKLFAPSADRVTGTWVDSGEYPWDKCDKCGYVIKSYYADEYKFCPNCGAKMG